MSIEKSQKQKIYDAVCKGDRNSWNRKRRIMDDVLDRIRPVEDQIAILKSRMEPDYARLTELRDEMLEDCIHPEDYLVGLEDGTVICKFCERRVMTQAEAPIGNV